MHDKKTLTLIMSAPNVLDKDTLDRLEYHWLLGKRYKRTPGPYNIGRDVANPSLVAQMMTRCQDTQKKSRVLVFFYWLFNINQYAYNLHVLSAHEALQRCKSIRNSK